MQSTDVLLWEFQYRNVKKVAKGHHHTHVNDFFCLFLYTATLPDTIVYFTRHYCICKA